MSKPSKSKKPAITLETGSDPKLWRYDSLEEALAANADIVVQLMRPEKANSRQDRGQDEMEDGSTPEDGHV